MTQSLSRVAIHAVFSTKSRIPFLGPQLLKNMKLHLFDIAKQQSVYVYEVGGYQDHVHILLTLPRTTALAKLMEEIKSSTTRWIKKSDSALSDFSWQRGYGAFSVSGSKIHVVQKYFQEQESHHKKMSFDDELKLLLKLY